MDFERSKIKTNNRTHTMEQITQHFLKLCFERENGSIELEGTNEVRKTWHVSDHVTVHFKCKYPGFDRSLVAKIYCKSATFSNEKILHELFSREVTMQKCVERIGKLLDTDLSPTLILSSETFRMLIEENRLRRGYLPKSPKAGLSLDESKEAIKLMARLHAGSVALREQNPALAATFDVRKILRECNYMATLFSKSMQKAIALMRKIYPIVAGKMEMNRAITMDQIIDLYNYDIDEFCVLNHGDFSVTNLIFAKYNSAPLLLNYQMAVYTSPAIDLLHFLNTSPETAVIYDCDEQLLKTYLYTLTDTMKFLNCITAPPTMEQLKEAIEKRILYAVFAGITFKLNTMLVEEDEENSNDNHYEELAKKMLLVMYHKNYFEYRKQRQFKFSLKGLLKNQA